jgi:hypothetical protein
MLNKMDVVPGDWVTLKKGNSKSLHRGFCYLVHNDLTVQGIKGRGLTFEKTDPPPEYEATVRPGSRRLIDWLLKLMPEYHRQIMYYGPNNHAHELMVYIDWAGKRVPMTPGKAFRKIFPNFHDMGIETLVDLYKTNFGPEEITFYRSKLPEDFSKVYRMAKSSRRSNFSTTVWEKSLANSCMQKKYGHLPHHPAYAYGSGDFEIIWGENQMGQLSCRTIVLSQHNLHFPKYATSYQAMVALNKYTQGIERVDKINNATAKVLMHKFDSRFFLMPYVDVGNVVKTEDEILWVLDWKHGQRVLYPGTSGYLSYG